MDTNSKFVEIEDLTTVKAGDKVAWCSGYNPNDDYAHFYTATVSKVTYKTITIDVTLAERWGSRTRSMEFRLKKDWSGKERLGSWGDKASGSVCYLTPDMEARIAAEEVERAQAAAEEKARKDQQEKERQERIANDHAAALDANPGIEPKLIGSVGDLRCYGFNMVNKRNEMLFVVVNAAKVKDRDWMTDEVKMVWKGVANYASGDVQYGPRSFGSTGEFQADTLFLLIQQAIFKVW